MRVIGFGLVVAAVLAGGRMGAQDAAKSAGPEASSVQVNANLVVLTTVVRDKKGALVQGLTKESFALTVGTKAQTIRYVDHEANQPLTVGLLVDVTRSMRDRLDDERDASKVFLDAVLAKSGRGDGTGAVKGNDVQGNKVFVVQFAKQIEMLQDVTDDRVKLDKALRLLGTESASFHVGEDKDTEDAEGRKIRGGGTAMYDAVFLSGQEVLARQAGRKVLVVITDGVDVGSKESLAEAVEAAQRSDTIVYAVYIRGAQTFDRDMGNPGARRGSGYPGGGYPGGGYPGGGYPGGGYPGGRNPNDPNDPNNPNNPNGPNTGGTSKPGTPSKKPSVDGKQVMARLCGETGGRVFELSKRQGIDEIYRQIAEELGAEYRIGFTPDEAGARNGFHRIDLEMADAGANKKLDVQVRSGYYAEGK